MDEGEMRMYRRELEIDGIVHDPLKAVHRIEVCASSNFLSLGS